MGIFSSESCIFFYIHYFILFMLNLIYSITHLLINLYLLSDDIDND